ARGDEQPARRTPRAIRSSRSDERYRTALAERARSLLRAPLAITPSADFSHAPTLASAQDDLGSGAQARGERILTLYFHQLFVPGASLIDLRASAFHEAGPALIWSPSAWIADWDPAFLTALRDVYLGFYTDDVRRFRAGLGTLQIASCEDLFRRHFGGGQAQQRFRTKEFVSTFHQVFVRCRDQSVELHPDFFALGIYLATLYDALDQEGVALDVRACFQRARDGAARWWQRAERGVQHAP
ncbi:MAG TPA: hypothetical protein VFZ61_24145, partial [Polyangiales bacterium]